MSDVVMPSPLPALTAKDFATDQEVRWCPGCGDYSILKASTDHTAANGHPEGEYCHHIRHRVQLPLSVLYEYVWHALYPWQGYRHSQRPESNPPRAECVDSDGDGDGLSIGGNHTIHLLRRNFNVNILLFNNQIYGLTKGQYSPTSEVSKVTKSTPAGSLDHPFNPLALAMGADASFIARSMDRDPKHLQQMLLRANGHHGTSLLEIYQNCNIFNDGAFEIFTEKSSKPEEALFLEQGQPLLYGADKSKGIRLDGYKPQIVNLADGFNTDDLWKHDETDFFKAQILTRFFDNPAAEGHMPRPFGVFYANQRATYEDSMQLQLDEIIATKGPGDLDKLLQGKETWTIAE